MFRYLKIVYRLVRLTESQENEQSVMRRESIRSIVSITIYSKFLPTLSLSFNYVIHRMFKLPSIAITKNNELA